MGRSSRTGQPLRTDPETFPPALPQQTRVLNARLNELIIASEYSRKHIIEAAGLSLTDRQASRQMGEDRGGPTQELFDAILEAYAETIGVPVAELEKEFVPLLDAARAAGTRPGKTGAADLGDPQPEPEPSRTAQWNREREERTKWLLAFLSGDDQQQVVGQLDEVFGTDQTMLAHALVDCGRTDPGAVAFLLEEIEYHEQARSAAILEQVRELDEQVADRIAAGLAPRPRQTGSRRVLLGAALVVAIFLGTGVGVTLISHMSRHESSAATPAGNQPGASAPPQRRPEPSVLTGHTLMVTSVAFSPDGTMLATAGFDDTARLWDTRTHQPIGQPLLGHTDDIWAVAFSPDGALLATASRDKTVRLWDVATGRPIGEPLTGHTDMVLGVAFSPDGALLATASRDGTVRLWNTLTHQPVSALIGHTNSVTSVVFSPDGTTLATASPDKTVRLWNVRTHQQIGEPLTGHTDSVMSVAYSPDGATLATASEDRTVRLWDAKTGRQVGEPLTGHTQNIWAVVFSPDGLRLATASLDETVRLWDTKTRQQIGEPLTGHTLGVTSVAFSPDGTMLATGSMIKQSGCGNSARRRDELPHSRPIDETPWSARYRRQVVDPITASFPAAREMDRNPGRWCRDVDANEIDVPSPVRGRTGSYLATRSVRELRRQRSAVLPCAQPLCASDRLT
ncbi:WD40 repeat domain-containing protein [Nocardia takedensis]|uniref:WD40 repeat domain-containing protein n=1 Tax=Nocardia takedensis TaxID=259390 RepID=UPI003F77323C